MTARIMRWISSLVVGRPWFVVAVAGVATAVLYSHIPHLRMGTDLTGLFGEDDPQWRAVSEFSRRLGYGNQLFVVVEAPDASDESAARMEAVADRLVDEMRRSGRFKFARASLSDDELLGMVRLFAWNFPAYVTAEQWDAVRRKLSEEQVRETVRRAAAGFVSPFSTLGANYFLADPLGLMEAAAQGSRGFSEFVGFDLEAGSGNHFFSKDRQALLVIAEPNQPAVDYEFAAQVVQWMRERIQAIHSEEPAGGPALRVSLAGAYVYAEQDRKFIEQNIRLISLISIIGNLVLCLLVYPRIPLLLMSLLPTTLGILWTTGVASYYPGEVNMISLSFIAILAGLGDDQIVHFFNRVPQEWAKGGTLDEAVARTYATTGHSIAFCALTMCVATVALALASFKALAEFGFVLTVGLVALMLHTVLTVPALMRLWWKVSKPRAPETVTFRFLPALARVTIDAAGRHARGIVAVSAVVFLVSLGCLWFVRMDRKIEIARAEDSPAIAGEKRLAAKFGIEGTPEMILIQGGEEEVLRRAESLSAALDEFKRRGVLKSVYTPSAIVPSFETQADRARSLKDVDLARAARVLEDSLSKSGFRIEPFRSFTARLREMAQAGTIRLDFEKISTYVPRGLLDNSIRKIGDSRYLAAIAFYPTDPNATEAVPEATVKDWKRQFGPFFEFSFNKINRDLQAQVARDSRRALVFTALGIILIVYLCFRDLRVSLLVLMPIAFAIVVTFGALYLAGHHFSFMAITAIPLILGISIDNSIHLVRRFLEKEGADVLEITKSSGAALIQSNLTTIVGFGALLASSFAPLAEMGLVTALGVGIALMAALWVVPAAIQVFWRRSAAG